jgi:hypothetical protein
MSDPIEIRLVADGSPQAFLWRGRLYAVINYGPKVNGVWRVRATRCSSALASNFDIHWDAEGWHLTEVQ